LKTKNKQKTNLEKNKSTPCSMEASPCRKKMRAGKVAGKNAETKNSAAAGKVSAKDAAKDAGKVVEKAAAVDDAIVALTTAATAADPCHVKIATTLLKHGVIDRAGIHLLQKAATEGKVALVRDLLGCKIHPNGRSYFEGSGTPLEAAIISPRRGTVMATITALLEAKATVNAHHFNKACVESPINCLYPLAMAMKDQSLRLCRIDFVIKQGLADTLQRLLQRKVKTSNHCADFVHTAVVSEQTRCVQILLAAGFRSKNPCYTLRIAARSCVGIATLLRQTGHDFDSCLARRRCMYGILVIGAYAGLQWMLDNYEWHTASLSQFLLRDIKEQGGRPTTVSILLNAKAQPLRATQYTPSTLIRSVINFPVMNLLLRAKANPNTSSYQGRFALHRRMTLQTATCLLEAKADPAYASPEGRTALGYRHKNVDVTLLLLKHGARPTDADLRHVPMLREILD
jgi:hypothetical protein